MRKPILIMPDDPRYQELVKFEKKYQEYLEFKKRYQEFFEFEKEKEAEKYKPRLRSRHPLDLLEYLTGLWLNKVLHYRRPNQ